jgi:hypothetical protein
MPYNILKFSRWNSRRFLWSKYFEFSGTDYLDRQVSELINEKREPKRAKKFSKLIRLIFSLKFTICKFSFNILKSRASKLSHQKIIKSIESLILDCSNLLKLGLLGILKA